MAEVKAKRKTAHKKPEEDVSKAGQPRLFPSEKYILDKWEEYKQYISTNDKPVTWAGMAYFLGCDRRTLYNYRNNEEYFPAIKTIQEWICMETEENCINRGSGAIFIAKNYGYTDTQQIEHSGSMPVKIVDDIK